MDATHYYHISSAGILTLLTTVDEALSMADTGGYTYFHYCNPKREELTLLTEPMGLHPLAIEDCFDTEQVPKIEDFPLNTFILYNTFKYHDGELSIDEVDLFLGENYLITISKDALDMGKGAGGNHWMERDMANIKQGPAFLMQVILDRIVDEKFIAIEKLEDEMEAYEEMILSDLSKFQPRDLLNLRRNLLTLRKSLFHEREILVKICRKDCPFIPDPSIYHYRDIYDHLSKFFELAEAYRDIVSGLMELYLSMMNNKMTLVANQTNISVRRLTFITTIFMPLTLLAGIGGMSEYSMMTGPGNWKYAYPAFLLGLGLLGIASYYSLRWLERKGMDPVKPLE
jgi:magnesium transporter